MLLLLAPFVEGMSNGNRTNRNIQIKKFSLKNFLIIIAVDIRLLVLQNLEIIPVTQDVRV